jgi:hypothetical protein
VASRIGRLANTIPIQYRHTPIEKMLKNGKIGGVHSIEKQFQNHKEAQQYAFSEERNGKSVDVLLVRSPNTCRINCRWKGRNWNGN